jgi:hypothetical protein
VIGCVDADRGDGGALQELMLKNSTADMSSLSVLKANAFGRYACDNVRWNDDSCWMKACGRYAHDACVPTLRSKKQAHRFAFAVMTKGKDGKGSSNHIGTVSKAVGSSF